MGSVQERFPIPIHSIRNYIDAQISKRTSNSSERNDCTTSMKSILRRKKAFPAITCVEGAARGVQTTWSGQERPWEEMERMGTLFVREAMGHSAGRLFWQWNLVRIVCSILYILALVFFWLLKLRRTPKEISFFFISSNSYVGPKSWKVLSVYIVFQMVFLG